MRVYLKDDSHQSRLRGTGPPSLSPSYSLSQHDAVYLQSNPWRAETRARKPSLSSVSVYHVALREGK